MRPKAYLALLFAGLAACDIASPTMIAGIPTRSDPQCVISEVIDGDTVKLACRDGVSGNIRLTGYVTPETYRPGCAAERQLGLAATAYLEQQLRAARSLDVKYEGIDKYDRTLVQLSLDGRDLADIMIARGLAVSYSGGRRINWCEKLLSG